MLDVQVISEQCLSTLISYMDGKSALYQMDGSYYLCLRKGTASYEKYSRACVQAIEFGTLYSADIKKLALFEEHGQCLAEDYALKKVRFES